MVLESEDLSQKAEKFSGPQNTMKREIIVRKRLFTLYRVRSCIGPVDPLICVVVRNTETVRERIATALTPKKRIRVCPDRVGLIAKEKIRIKLVRLGRALVCLKVE